MVLRICWKNEDPPTQSVIAAKAAVVGDEYSSCQSKERGKGSWSQYIYLCGWIQITELLRWSPMTELAGLSAAAGLSAPLQRQWQMLLPLLLPGLLMSQILQREGQAEGEIAKATPPPAALARVGGRGEKASPNSLTRLCCRVSPLRGEGWAPRQCALPTQTARENEERSGRQRRSRFRGWGRSQSANEEKGVEAQSAERQGSPLIRTRARGVAGRRSVCTALQLDGAFAPCTEDRVSAGSAPGESVVSECRGRQPKPVWGRVRCLSVELVIGRKRRH